MEATVTISLAEYERLKEQGEEKKEGMVSFLVVGSVWDVTRRYITKEEALINLNRKIEEQNKDAIERNKIIEKLYSRNVIERILNKPIDKP